VEPRELPFSRQNAIPFLAGLAMILLGYLCLGQPPVDGFLSLTLAPILLVLGYCVAVPFALLRNEPAPQEPPPEGLQENTGG
jgi:hypothetical protein